jgi:glycosyltransferase involved in cell wall biosynthesis
MTFSPAEMPGPPRERSTTRCLRILVAHNVPRRRNGGMSRMMGFIHDAVEAEGHTVEFLCSDDLPQLLSGKLSRISFPLMVFRYVRSRAREGLPYDIVNVHEPSAAFVIMGSAFAGRPTIVVTTYGIERRGWTILKEDLRTGRQHVKASTRITHPLLTLTQSAFGLRYADHVFCANYEDRKYLVEHLGRPAGSVTCIRPGADSCFADAARHREYGRASKLIFAGTWIERKGIQDLVTAFSQLAQKYTALSMTVLGGGVADDAIMSSFPDRLRPRILCRHAKDDREAAQVFADADLFVLPSLFEGTPLTLIEAMASGLPIVTTATCGMRDIIRDSENGLLVPTRSPKSIVDAVDRLLRSTEMRTKLGRSARADALASYSWAQAAEPVKDAYRRIARVARQ